MTIDYDMPSDTLTIRWCGDHEDARWRMARSNVDLLVDYANETSAVRIHSASHYAPDLDGASVSFHSQLNIGGLCMRNRAHYQPQLPWDEVPPPKLVTRCAHLCNSQRGICVYCGAVAQHRHAPCKKDGWSMHNLCPRCERMPGDQWPRDWYTETMNEAAERIAAKTYAYLHEPPTPAQIAAAAPVLEDCGVWIAECGLNGSGIPQSAIHTPQLRALPRRKQCKPFEERKPKSEERKTSAPLAEMSRSSTTWMTPSSSQPVQRAERPSHRPTPNESQRADR